MNDDTTDYFNKIAELYDVTPEALHEAWATYRERVKQYREPDLSTELESVANDVSPHQPELMIRSTIDTYRRAAIIQWARAARVPASTVLTWYDTETIKAKAENKYASVSMITLGKQFPVELPRDDDGMIDLNLLPDTYNDPLNRALIYDQLAEVNYAMTWGGDDNWFDYLPDGLAILTMLQAENWYDSLTIILNNPHTYQTIDDDEVNDEREAFHERFFDLSAISMQDVVSGFIYALTEDRDDEDRNVYLPARLTK